MPVAAVVFPGVGERGRRVARLAQARGVDALGGQFAAQPGAERVVASDAAEGGGDAQPGEGHSDVRRSAARAGGESFGGLQGRGAVGDDEVDQDLAHGKDGTRGVWCRRGHRLRRGRAGGSGAGLAADFVDLAHAFEFAQDGAELADPLDLDRGVERDGAVVVGGGQDADDIDPLVGQDGADILEEPDPIPGLDLDGDRECRLAVVAP